MIPPDVASALRTTVVDSSSAQQSQQTQPVTPAQRIADVLSNLVPGQRILAEVQALLPNGSYRALVGQRDVTLALPFAAKAGDSLELEVAETNGKLTLAFVANRSDAQGKNADPSVATFLSRAGKQIGDLMQGVNGEGKRAPAAPLNGNQALVSTMPKDGASLAPLLKQALSQSGVFYEAHQARWVSGQLPAEQLRMEPQGKLSQAAANQAQSNTASSSPTQINAPRAETAPAQSALLGGVPRDIAPIVQQQLDGLANQNFAWQGQVWPGQKMWWEIGENSEDRQLTGEEASARWHTRLKLQLPKLGDIDARLHLQPGGELGIRILSGSSDGEIRLRDALPALQKQLEAAGLSVRQLLVDHGTEQAE
jgi:hypothetical protein